MGGNDEEVILSTCSEATDFYTSIRVFDMRQNECVQSNSYFYACSHDTNQAVLSFFGEKNRKYDIYVSGSGYCNGRNQGTFTLNVICPKSISLMTKKDISCDQQVTNSTEGLMASTMLLPYCYMDSSIGFTGALVYSIQGKGNEVILSTCGSEISSSVRVYNDKTHQQSCVAGSSYFSGCSTNRNSGVVSFIAEADNEYTVLVS